jgi:hypothetical protein
MLLFLCSFVIDFVLHIKASEPLRVVCFSHNLSPLLVIVFVLLFMNKMALTQKKKKKKNLACVSHIFQFKCFEQNMKMIFFFLNKFY